MASGMISDEDIQKVRDATDLVSLVSERVQLKQKGREFWGCCPLHNEKTPSFKVDPSSQFWHCFGCDEGGDIFGFVMKLDGLSFPEAVRKLAERANIEISASDINPEQKGRNARLKQACNAAQAFFHHTLMRVKSPEADAARAYLSSRGLGGDIPTKWQLGFAPGRKMMVNELLSQGFKPKELIDANVAVIGKDGKLHDRFFNRIMFPIHDISGECIAFGGRVIDGGSPKYLNTGETPIFHKSKVLYGLDKAKASMAATGCAIVSEGYTDVIAMHKAGIDNSVATLGTALTKFHIRQLARQAGKKIVYLFDGDLAGQRATERALQFIDETITPEAGLSKLDICALSLPDGKDPAEFIDTYGQEKLKELISAAKPLILYGIERRIQRHDLSIAEDRARALTESLEILAPIKESILAKDYAAQIANMLNYRVDDVLSQLQATKVPKFNHQLPEENNQKPVSQNLNLQNEANLAVNNENNSAKAQIPHALLNRMAIEKEVLALCCALPMSALTNADTVSTIKWSTDLHANLAAVLLETLLENLEATPAELLQICSDKVAGSASILTSAISSYDGISDERLEFFLQELQIEDLENEIGKIKSASLNNNPLKVNIDINSKDEKLVSETIDDPFEQLVNMQAKLASMKNSRKPMP